MVETLGAYKILDVIGEGGIGIVYRARDTRHGRTVALRVVSDRIAGDPRRRESFLQDARSAASLSHPNIAALYEVGEEHGSLFLATEFVPGETLRAVIGGRPLNARRALDLAVQIADALAEAHASEVVHGDLRPDTILVTPKGNAKILDFGLAAWTRGGADRRAAPHLSVRSVGAAPGAIAYLSPEQALGEAFDYRTDIFSLGVMLFEMLTGRLPFAASEASGLRLQVVQAPSPELRTINPSLPDELDAILIKALAKSVAGRYEVVATMAAEMRAVSAILDTRAAAAEAIPTRVVSSRAHKGRGRWMALLLLLVMALAVAWFAGGF